MVASPGRGTMMVVVGEEQASKRINEARRRAELVLPRAVDLWGLSWDRDDDALDVDASSGDARDDCLPESFPEAARLAVADVTFVRARKGGLVHAMSAVFDDPLSAHQAWRQLGDIPFVTCFAESVVAAVEVEGDVELLGPVVQPDPAGGADPGTDHPSLAAARAGRRTTRARVTLAAASDAALLPIAIDVAVIVAGPVVVMLWAVERPGPAKDRGWSRLVERIERKCEVAAAP